jgi:hypothetical protein
LNIFKTNGAYRATLDSIDQNSKDIPVARIVAHKDSVQAELPALGARFQGDLNADRTEIAGSWKQLNASFPLTLKRTTEPARISEAMAANEYAPRADSDLQGAWQGSLKVGNVDLRLNLRLADAGAGTFRGQLDSPDQGVRNLPLTSIAYQKPTVRFELAKIGGVFEGNAFPDKMVGTWMQGGKKLPLTFQRDTATPTEEGDYGQQADHQVQGHWLGTLEVNKTPLRVVFHIALMPDGSYRGTLDSPDQGGKDIPASAVRINPPYLRMEWQAIGASFDGVLKSGKISGTWRQGPASLPLQLERNAVH